MDSAGKVKERIAKLREAIEKYRYSYHVLDKDMVAPEVLDSLKKELFDLEALYPELITPDSPTQRVAGKPLAEFKKVKHSLPMLSLNDAFSREDMEAWYASIIKLLPGVNDLDFYCEQKFDGLAMSFIYRKGLFTEGSTRGDGYTGEDVTQNLKTIEAIPLRLHDKETAIIELKRLGLTKAVQKLEKDWPETIEIRGEVFLTKKEFLRLNKEREKENLPLYANPRNLVAGSIRQLDPKITAERKLDAYGYILVTDLGQTTHEEEHLIMKALGFKTNPHNALEHNLEGVYKFYEQLGKERDNLEYEIDGTVINVNEIKFQKILGVVGKAPRWAIAYKFAPRQASTIVEDISVQVGRTGVITPVAHLKPVLVGGTVITRSTLHNKEEIKRLGLKIGDTVIVTRAGDVIPKITEVLPDLRTGEEKDFVMPKECPECHTKVVLSTDNILTICPNKHCPARDRNRLYHFTSKAAFDIKGLGRKILDKLVDAGLIEDVDDIFTLSTDDLKSLPGFGDLSAFNLIDTITKKRVISLEKFLVSLSISHIGDQNAYLVADYLTKQAEWRKLTIKSPRDIWLVGTQIGAQEWQTINAFGPKIGESLADYFSHSENQELLEKLSSNGITLTLKTVSRHLAWHNVSFVFTGTLSQMNRDQAENEVKVLGGKVSGSVTAKTNYLVYGENPGSKYTKALNLGVPMLSERDFLELLAKVKKET
ncbi:MAG TPA: NAD-dependent DNA ligase LigA [Candidatus Paceibacterota bacterium]|nr:NAD-dependent DNA ligase LigA [Candidatus Paceibacterota bacterium]